VIEAVVHIQAVISQNIVVYTYNDSCIRLVMASRGWFMDP